MTVEINSTEQIAIVGGTEPVLIIDRPGFMELRIMFGNATALAHFYECVGVLVDNELALQRKHIAATYSAMVEENLRMQNLIGGVTSCR